MSKTTLQTIQDCDAFLEGALWMGTGGGGSYQDGLKILADALDEGLSLGWVDAESIEDDLWTVTVGIHGSITPLSVQVLEQARLHGLAEATDEWYLVKAVKELGASLGHSYGCVVPAELGPESVAIPLAVGARMGIPVVDGDYVGRAVPEETQSTYCLYEKQSNLFAGVDRWGNSIFVRNAVNTHSLERMAKMLAIASYGEIAVATTPLIASEMKEIIVPHTLSTCFKIGQALRAAREAGRDPINAGLETIEGYRLFDGRITTIETEDRDGYLFGTVEITGEEKHLGHTLKIWFKNENLVSWLDDAPWICSPDLFTIVDREGLGIYNSALKEGDEIVVLGMRAPEAFRSEEGLALMGPRYFDFDIDYRPIEDLVSERNPT
jgi:DUF917 family protein